MELIDKAEVLAEIERRIKVNKECMLGLRNLDYYQGKIDALNDTLFGINTLEVTEVDLEKELIKWHKQHFKKDGTFIGMSGFYLTNSSQMDIAKHFFELGLRAKIEESEPTHFATSEINDLVKAAINAADEDMQGRQIMEASNDDRQRYSRIFRRGFKAGANWQEQQINKNAIYGIVAGRVKDEVFVASRWFKDDKLKPAEDIKLIIIKS